MREIKEIIDAHKKATEKGFKTILATVVHVEGSSYRRPSARMLVDENGVMTGAISGGCLEGDALRKALYALEQEKNTLITYDTSDEADAIIGAQLGCNGIIQVLFEPIDPNKLDNPLALLAKVVTERKTKILVTFFNLKKRMESQLGTSMLIEDKQIIAGGTENGKILNQVISDIDIVLDQEASLFREYTEGDLNQNVFIEYFAPPISLVIVGAGNDTQVLAKMADLLGWKIVVVDGRPTHANKGRFIGSCQVIVSKPEAVLEEVELDEKTVFVLVTHNYNYDLAVLKCLIEQEKIPYIGILGPKKKFDRMVSDLATEGIQLSRQQLTKIYAPIGLELGAETPEEIALSITSEIMAVLSGASGTFLREKKAPIHSKHNTQFDSIRI